jgi:hypothetical protein
MFAITIELQLTRVTLRAVVAGIYQEPIEKYFSHYKVPVVFKLINGGELNKNMDVSGHRFQRMFHRS